jgi:hypothetical protein
VNQEFEIRYVSPAILRMDNSEFLLIYEDSQGKLEFSGLKRHPKAMLYVPSAREWDSLLSSRRGQREIVADRLLEFLRDDPDLDSYRQSVKNPNYFASFPGEGARLRSRWMANDGVDKRAALNRLKVRPRLTMRTVGLLACAFALAAAPKFFFFLRHSKRAAPVLTPAAMMRFQGIESPPNDLVYTPVGMTVIRVERAGNAEYSTLRCDDSYDRGPASHLLVNAAALAGIARSPREFPVDSVIFKMSEDPSGRDPRVVAMRKREAGYDPKNGDWSYLNGKSLSTYDSGRLDRCISCHAKAAANDYVFNRFEEKTYQY